MESSIDRRFSFRILNMLSQLHLSSMVSEGKLTISLIEGNLYMMRPFRCFQDSHCICGFCQFDCKVTHCGYLCVYLRIVELLECVYLCLLTNTEFEMLFIQLIFLFLYYFLLYLLHYVK